MRICESGEVIEILCGCFGCILYGSPFMRDILRSPCKEEAYRIPYVKYSTGTDKRFALCIVRLGNPIRRPPEGRLDYGRRNDNTHNVTTSFFCASALFRVSSALFFHIFSRKRGWNQIATQRSGCNLERTSSEMYEFCRLRRNEEYGACEDEPAERRHGASKSIAPSAHPNAEKSRPCGRLSIYLLSRASLLRGWRHRPSADAASLRPFPYGRRRAAYRRTGGPSSCAAAG